MEEKLLLNTIFDLAQELYAAMQSSESKPESDHNKIFRLFTELAQRLVDADRASFWKWDKRMHTLWTTAAVGEEKIVIPENTGLVGKALQEKKVIITNDPYHCPDFNSDVDKSTGYVTKSILVMPVCDCKGEYIGAYQAINKNCDEGFNDSEDVRRLTLAAFICGITLESENFLDASRRDKLTGLKNRMGFYADYAETYEPNAKAGKETALFICDIDHFKKVNDTYGHNAGDAVLKHVANILSLSVGDKYGIYRWGGEEFICVMPDTDIKGAYDFAQEVRKLIQESVCRFEELEIRITMSFGITKLDPSLSAEQNIAPADERLYTAKESGRNCVIAGDDSGITKFNDLEKK